jgi:uracil-DNA glycosylase family 4
MSAPGANPTLRELLAFYQEAGVDCALEEHGVDRFAAAPEQPPARPSPVAAAPQPAQRAEQPAPPRIGQATVPDQMQTALAREAALSADSLEALHTAMQNFEGCNLRLTAKQLVFADGNPNASLMLVGEAPGRDEDIEGRPFVGRSGQLLDRILAAIGLDRTAVYIANVVPWRPPGNRTPTPHETEICRPFIERQIELVGPKVLVTLGGPSAKTLLHQTDGILKLRGKWRTHVTPGGLEIPTMPTLHPAYLLRNPAHKKLAWRDFLEIRQRLGA